MRFPCRVSIVSHIVMFVVIWEVVTIMTYMVTSWSVGSSSHADKDAERKAAIAYWKARGLEVQEPRWLKRHSVGLALDDLQAYSSNLVITRRHRDRDVAIRRTRLKINESDILVVMHIQKTGGTTLENALVQDTNVQPPCRCGPMPDCPNRLMCACLNDKGQDWMFNRHSVGWPCGVHPGFNELTTCVDDWFSSQRNENRTRTYRYLTMLREPVTRFVSEWVHVRRGATWKESRLSCDGRDANTEEVPFCFTHGNWKNVTFQQFVACSSNMAINRQTRMLANLSLSDCYRLNSNLSSQERDEIMLRSAKRNLARFFTFFGLMEYQRETQLLFEKTFTGLRFNKAFHSKKGSVGTKLVFLSSDIWEQIISQNHLDVQLYQYAKDLFLQRLKKARVALGNYPGDARTVDVRFTYTEI